MHKLTIPLLLTLGLTVGCAGLPKAAPHAAPTEALDAGALESMQHSIIEQVQKTVQTVRTDHDLGERTRDLYETAFLVASCAFVGMLMIALAAPAFPKAWLNTTLALLGVALIASPMVYLLTKRGVIG